MKVILQKPVTSASALVCYTVEYSYGAVSEIPYSTWVSMEKQNEDLSKLYAGIADEIIYQDGETYVGKDKLKNEHEFYTYPPTKKE